MNLASPTRTPLHWRRFVASRLLLGVALTGSSLLAAVEPASATPPVISVANSTIACTGVSGLAKFDPHLQAKGTASGLETVHLNLTLTGCSSPALPPPISISGELKGALVANTGTSCSTTLGMSPYSSIGTLTVKWKTHKAKIAPASLFAPQRVKPAKVQHKAGTNQTIKVGGPGSPRPSVVGDFTGGNGGRSSSFTLSWKRSTATCSAGLVALPIVSGALAFS
jgi:hypothetical protein